MYSILSLYLGLILLLLTAFILKIKNKLFYKVTIVLTIKILFITVLYLLFFFNVAKVNKIKNFMENKILYNDNRP